VVISVREPCTIFIDNFLLVYLLQHQKRKSWPTKVDANNKQNVLAAPPSRNPRKSHSHFVTPLGKPQPLKTLIDGATESCIIYICIGDGRAEEGEFSEARWNLHQNIALYRIYMYTLTTLTMCGLCVDICRCVDDRTSPTITSHAFPLEPINLEFLGGGGAIPPLGY